MAATLEPRVNTPSEAAGRAGGRPIVEMRDAVKRFGDLVATDHVTLTVTEGTVVGLIGPSGSGKTTIVRLLTGGLKPSEGEVRVLGEDPTRYRRRTRERIGYMPQQFILYPDLTAAENLSFVAALFGLYGRARSRRIDAMLDLVQLTDARNRRAKDLSGGMQRRLELACALVHDPAVLFIDEPTAGIDPLLRQAIWAEFRRLRDAGRTLLVTTQYVGEAEYCDRVAVLDQGRLVHLDAPEEMRRTALGGEVIEVELRQPIDTAPLVSVPGVTAVRWTGPRTLLTIVEDAGGATPRLLEAIGQSGGEVVSSREYRPTFDEVFAELLARDRAEQGTGA
jgi:ABC-2 type transport system ATP-binding protein